MARQYFRAGALRSATGAIAASVAYVAYTDSAGTVLADISSTSGGSSISGSTVTTSSLGLLEFYGPPAGTTTLYVRCPAQPSLGVQRIDANADDRLDALEAAAATQVDARTWISGTPGTTFAADIAGINAAIAAVYALGGGEVHLPDISGGYKIGRKTVGQQHGGGIFLRAGVDLIGNNTKLVLQDNCHFIYCQSDNTTTVTVTADTTVTTTNLTVDTTTGLVVGRDVVVVLGDSAGDPAEPEHWLFAKITAIPDATHVTLDRPVGYAMTVASTNIVRRQVRQLDELIENVRISGFELINAQTGSANAEAGVFLRYVRNIRVDNLIGEHVGAGIVLAQWCEDIKGSNHEIRKCDSQGGSTSKGRCYTLSSCRTVRYDTIRCERFERNVLYAEEGTVGAVLDGVEVVNNHASRSNTTVALFHTSYKTAVKVRRLDLTGNTSYIFDDGVGLTSDLILEDPTFRASANLVNDSRNQFLRGQVQIGDTRYDEVRRFTKLIRLVPSMSGDYGLPDGYYRRARFYASSLTGLAFIRISTGEGATWDAIAQGAISAGVVNDVFYGSGAHLPAQGTGVNRVSAKQLTISSDGTVLAGAFLWLEVEYWPLTTESAHVATLDQADLLLFGTARDASLYRSAANVLGTAGLLQTPMTAPSAPASGAIAYVDTADSKAKVIKANGDIIVLGETVRSAITRRASTSIVANGITFVDLDTALDITLAAASGDKIEASVSFMWSNESVLGYIDVATIVSAAPVTYFSSGTGTPATDGVLAWFGTSAIFRGTGGSVMLTLGSGDISAGTVKLRLRVRTGTAANKTVIATSGDPLLFMAKNLGPG